MLFVIEDIPSKLLSLENYPMEGFYVEVNSEKTKWLPCCSYNPNRCEIDLHQENFMKLLFQFLAILTTWKVLLKRVNLLLEPQ